MALVGIVMLPFYVDALGMEAYGLVGLYVALQSWLAMLDLGLSATLAREAARFRAGAVDPAELGRLLRLVERIFAAIALIVGLGLIAGAGAIASHWLQNQSLGDAEAADALRLMGPALALRFLVIPFRGFLTGLEDLTWVGGANAAVTTLRSILVLPALWLFGANLNVFFLWQLGAGLLELLMFAVRTRRRAPAPAGRHRWTELSKHWRFSLAVAASAAIWVAATNADKVLVSGLLPLQDYAFFSIAVIAAGGVMLITGPIPVALGPRFSKLHAERDEQGLARLYGQATQLTAMVAFPACLTLAFFSAETLWGWTGNARVAERGASALALYALGNGLLAIGALPLQLQVAAGRLRLHLLGTGLFVAIYLPLLWWATSRWGMTGAGGSWLAVNLLFALGWVAVAHHVFLPASHLRWLFGQVLAILLPTVAAAWLIHQFLPWPGDRWLVIAQLVAVGFALLLVAAASASTLRGHLLDFAKAAAGAAR